MHFTFVNPATGEAKSIKQGFSWTLFFFSPFYGIPLFIRGLHAHGIALAALGIAGLFVLGTEWMLLVGLLQLGAMFFYGLKGNELTVDRLLDQGWEDADYVGSANLGLAGSWSPVAEIGEASSPQSQLVSEKTCPRCAETIKAAALVCKHCGAKFGRPGQRVARRSGSPSVATVIAVGIGALVVLLAIGVLVEQGEEGELAVAAQDAPVRAVTARELFAAYQRNEQAAQMEYGGQTLEISGTIDSIELDAADLPMVSLVGDGAFGMVTLHFSDVYANDTAALRRGETFTARCSELSEILGSPQLNGCRPVDHSPSGTAATEDQAYAEEGDYSEDGDYVEDDDSIELAKDLIRAYGGTASEGTASAPEVNEPLDKGRPEPTRPQQRQPLPEAGNQLSDEQYEAIRRAQDRGQ